MDYLHDFYADTAMFGGGVPPRVAAMSFWRGARGFCHRPAGPVAPTIKTVEGAKPAGGRATRDLLRQRGATAEYEIPADQPGYFSSSFDVRRAGDPGKTGWVAGRKTVIELVTSSSFGAWPARARPRSFRAPAYRAMGVRRMPGFAHRIGHFSLLCLPKQLVSQQELPRPGDVPEPGSARRSCLIQLDCTSSHQLPTFHSPQAPRPPSSSEPK